MKRLIRVVISVLVAVGTLTGSKVFATTNIHRVMLQKLLQLNGENISKPSGFIAAGTTYIPIYYVMQLLQKCGLTNTWAGGLSRE